MTSIFKYRLPLSACVLAIALPQVAHAQNAESAATGSGEIVVTAQKRSERLLDVPVAVSAISADTLTSQNVTRLVDFYDKVPGLQYSGQRVTNISLRGITTGGATSPTIAILVDDVQFGGTTNAGQPPLPDFDASALERIEVLRGPQGTLYGASSLGGLIKYVLRAPNTNDFSGRIEVGGNALAHGGFGYAVRGSLNVPVADWLAVSGSGFYRDDAPYLDNASTSPAVTKRKDVNTREAWGFRGAVLARPTDNLTITLSALNQKVDALNSDLAVTSGGVPICTLCYKGATADIRRTAPVTFEPVYGDLTINSLDSINNSKFALYTGKVELDLDSVNVTSLTAWSRADNVITSDVSAVFSFLPPIYGVPGGTVQIANADYTHKFSQELRIGGTGDTFDWLIGGFYTVENVGTNQTLLLRNSAGDLAETPYIGLGPSRYREISGFGDVTWHVNDKFDIQVGGRYAKNKQTSFSDITVDGPAQVAFGPSAITELNSSDSAFTWLISPSYHITPDMMIYARIASGYRPGGPNLDATGVGPYGPDRVVNYELGFKGKVIPDVLTIDTAIFQIDWSKIQLQGTAANNFTFISNGGKARSRGIEFSASLTPWEGMSIDGNFAISDSELTEDLPRLAGNNASLQGAKGDRLPATAKFTANITAQQSFPVKDGVAATIGATYSYIGNRSPGFNTFQGNLTGRPPFLIPAYSVVNVNAGVTIDDVWSASVYVRNLFDKRGIATAQNRNGQNVPTALFIQPTNMGITLARKF